MSITRARIVGVDVPLDKKLKVSLTYVKGIGDSLSYKILERVKIDPEVRTKEISEEELKKLNDIR